MRAAFLLLFSLGCGDKDVVGGGDTGNSVEPREFSDCDPLSFGYCSLPFPSSFYLREDPTTATGYRIRLGATTLPATDQSDISYQPDPWSWNERDGFSPLGPLLFEFPGMTLTGVPLHDDIAASMEDSAPIVILDAESGERVPYFAELDWSGDSTYGQFMFVRPVTPLKNGHRYVVGVRNIVDSSGTIIAPSAGYKALRDGEATDNWDIEGRRDLYADIFSILEQDGWARAETQLAWDFVVGSTEGITGRAQWIVDDMLATVGTAGPSYTILSTTDEYDEHIYRWIEGEMTVPLYTETDGPGTLLTRDENGQPYQNGETTVGFSIIVPRTAVTDPRPLALLQYGHGLLGSRDELGADYLGEIADRYGYIIFAVDWTGMKGEDSDAIVQMILTDLSNFAMLPERSMQGFGEFAAAVRLMTGGMVNDEAMMFPDPETGELISVIDPNNVYYYGNSQGGILGGSYMALTPDIERGVLGVSGMPYSLLLSRSADFEPFFAVFKSVFDDQRDISFYITAMQILWDQGEPSGYGLQVNQEPLEGRPAHQILLQDAIGDAQVTTLGAHVQARAYQAALIGTPYEEVWGLPVESSGYVGSALVEYEHGAPTVPFENTPPDDEYDTHESTRRTFAAQEQLNTFLTTGTVVDYCDGVCDPE